MGGGKCTRERALLKNSGPLQKSFWSAQSWICCTEKKTEQRHPRGVENVPYDGGPKPPFGRGVICEVFLPPLFSTPWRPLNASGMHAKGRAWSGEGLTNAALNFLHLQHLLLQDGLQTTVFASYQGTLDKRSYSPQGGLSAFQAPLLSSPS